MALLSEKLDKLIMEAIKSNDIIRRNTLRFIKTEFLNWKTAKENVGKEFTNSIEIQILYKMIKSRMKAIDEFQEANNEILANEERAEIEIIKEYLPLEVSREQIESAFNTIQLEKGWELSKKNMGNYIKAIKEIYPGADGKLVSEIVKNKLV